MLNGHANTPLAHLFVPSQDREDNKLASLFLSGPEVLIAWGCQAIACQAARLTDADDIPVRPVKTAS